MFGDGIVTASAPGSVGSLDFEGLGFDGPVLNTPRFGRCTCPTWFSWAWPNYFDDACFGRFFGGSGRVHPNQTNVPHTVPVDISERWFCINQLKQLFLSFPPPIL